MDKIQFNNLARAVKDVFTLNGEKTYFIFGCECVFEDAYYSSYANDIVIIFYSNKKPITNIFCRFSKDKFSQYPELESRLSELRTKLSLLSL